MEEKKSGHMAAPEATSGKGGGGNEQPSHTLKRKEAPVAETRAVKRADIKSKLDGGFLTPAALSRARAAAVAKGLAVGRGRGTKLRGRGRGRTKAG